MLLLTWLSLSMFLISANSRCLQPYWTQIPQAGTVPPGMSNSAGVYVEHAGFYLFGGLNGSAGTASDNPVNTLYKFDPDTRVWTNLSYYPNAPSPRAEALMWPSGSGFLIAGGRGPFRRNADLTHNDTHQFVLNGGWVYLGESQHANRSGEAAYVPKRAYYTSYAFSGVSSTLPRFINRPGALRNDTVSYTPADGWKRVLLKPSSPNPRPRAFNPFIANDDGKYLYLYGGYTNDPSGNQTFGEVNYLKDLWEFDVHHRTYVPLKSIEPSPGKRDNAKLFYEGTSKLLWLVGGANWNGPIMDLWAYALDYHRWTNVTDCLLGGTQPPLRQGAASFTRYFEDRIEFWLFGGSAGELDPPRNDMWRLTIPRYFDPFDCPRTLIRELHNERDKPCHLE